MQEHEECPSCFQRYEWSVREPHMCVCGYTLCRRCAIEWGTSNGNCPSCRAATAPGGGRWGVCDRGYCNLPRNIKLMELIECMRRGQQENKEGQRMENEEKPEPETPAPAIVSESTPPLPEANSTPVQEATQTPPPTYAQRPLISRPPAGAIQPPRSNNNNSGSATLHSAAQEGDTDTVRALIKRGAMVDARNADDWTPLHVAASNGHTDTVKLLLDKGANFRAVTHWKWTPLHCAAYQGHTDTARALLDAHAEINARDEDGQTPFALASENCRNEVAKFLRSKGGR